MSTKIDNRIWLVITIVVALALLAGSWFIGAQPLMNSALASGAQLVSVQAQNDLTKQQLSKLAEAKRDLPDLEDERDRVVASVPSTLAGSAFIKSINEMAAARGVTVEELTFGAATPYSAPNASAGGETAAPVENGASASPSASVPTADETAVPEVPGPATDPSVTASNFVLVAMTLKVSGARDALLAFANDIQTGDRLVLVNSFTVGAEGDTEGAAPTLELGGFVYVLNAAAAAAATPTNG